MKKSKDDIVFSFTLAVPNGYTMEESVEFIDKQISAMRNKVIKAIGTKKGVKVEWAN